MIYYVITASQPGRSGEWRKNIFVGVAARSIYKAMDLFSEAYPDAIISNIAKRGDINLGISAKGVEE